MEMTLSLSCPDCGAKFTSTIQMDPDTWVGIEVENNLERCSCCGFFRRYQKFDYFFT